MSFDIINNLLHDDEGKMKKIPQEKSHFNRAFSSGNTIFPRGINLYLYMSYITITIMQ